MSFNEFMNEIKFLYTGTFYHEFLQKLGIVENFKAVKEHLISATVEFKNPNTHTLNLREQYTEDELVDFLQEMRKYAYSNNAITNVKIYLTNKTELIYTIDRGWEKINTLETQEVLERMSNALDVLLNLVDEQPEKTIFDDEDEEVHSDNNRLYCGKAEISKINE